MFTRFEDGSFVLLHEGELAIVKGVRHGYYEVETPRARIHTYYTNLTAWTLKPGDQALVNIPLDSLASGYQPVRDGATVTINKLQIIDGYWLVCVRTCEGETVNIHPNCLRPSRRRRTRRRRTCHNVLR